MKTVVRQLEWHYDRAQIPVPDGLRSVFCLCGDDFHGWSMSSMLLFVDRFLSLLSFSSARTTGLSLYVVLGLVVSLEIQRLLLEMKFTPPAAQLTAR